MKLRRLRRPRKKQCQMQTGRRRAMVDPMDAIGKARAAVTERAELPGMSLMEHLDELRRRLVHSILYLAAGFIVAWIFRDPFVAFIQAPLVRLHKTLVFTHPMDPLNLQLQVSLVGGAIVASPFILFQVWLFIAPGLYQKERRFVIPFMAATVGLFLGGAAFGYYYVLPGALKILIVDFGKNFTSMVTIEDYSSFFLSIILGLGISFEMPILIFFLAMFGIVSPKFLWNNIRYAILAVFLVAACICPSPDPWTMCIYAVPMLALYLIGIAVAWWVHPSRRKAKEAKEAAK
jgi:sec-independent protein translocase protein TatC